MKFWFTVSSCLVAAMTVFGAGAVWAKDCNGVSFPDEAQVAGSALTLNGLGLRQATMLKVNVYVAALYVASVSTDANALLGANTPGTRPALCAGREGRRPSERLAGRV